MKVQNRGCIRRLGFKSMQAARARNRVAIAAIALTTLLFTSLFTVALSINRAFEEANFRQTGGFSHGTFKYLTEAQFDALKTDPAIRQYGLRRFVGMAEDIPFNKSHVELGYSDANQAHWMYCDPIEGRLPAEGTNEAATDTRVLELLGVTPALGAEFTLSFDVDGVETSQTFTLCGWWDYDPAIVASHVQLPLSRAQGILDETGVGSGIGRDGMTGSWSMDVMLSNSLQIEQDLNAILARHGYQSESRAAGDNYVALGVNWGYTGAQLINKLDPATAAAITVLLLIIVLTGYLIIYNVFQISVSNDIRFYGLLKTIGATGRQLRRMLRQQALLLSLAGIPVGLLAGYAVGLQLTPVVLNRLHGVARDTVSASPLIFIGSALFALGTVLLSCYRPGRMAAKVSPVEAVRYTEGATSRKAVRKARAGASLPKMAWANLGRSRGKTAVTVASLALAVLLLNLTVTFTSGFDLDKYLANMASDFILADAGYFQTGSIWGADAAVPEALIDELEAQPGLTDGGRVYGKASSVEEFITEDYFRARWGKRNDEAVLDELVALQEKNPDGLLADDAQLYGMDAFALGKLKLLEGDLAKLQEPGGHYLAAVYHTDDYGKPEPGSHWAKLGDTVTLRYVDEYEYFDPETGEVFDPNSPLDEGRPWQRRAKTYRDLAYEVAALVTVPNALSYRYYGSDEFVLGSEQFISDSGTANVLYYACDVEDADTPAMENFLSELTTERQTQLDYESKASYAEEFQSFRSMFLLLGGVLSFIIGLVGVLNFLNAVLTGILTRRREFAVLQAVGMTGRQLKTLLIWEGLLYALAAPALSLALALASGPLLPKALGSMFWFFTYRFTALPIACVTPVFVVLGVALPLAVYRAVSRQTVVERLREAE